MEKKKITIEVEPATAVATVGLLRGIFPSIIEQLERQAATNGSPLKFNKVENMQEVLDEIYEKDEELKSWIDFEDDIIDCYIK